MRATIAKEELLTDGSDSEFREFIHNLLAVVVRMNDVRAGYGSLLGLSGTGFAILVSILQQQKLGDVGINQVAAHLHLSGSFVTTEVVKLVDADLVEKTENSYDRRRVSLTLTPKALSQLDALTEIQGPVNAALFGSLTRKDFEQLSRIVERLVPCGDEALMLFDYLRKTRGKELFDLAPRTPRPSRQRGRAYSAG